MNSSLILILLMTFSACSCQELKYKGDLGFLNSAQANSPEYLVMINGKFCKDLDGLIGLCAKRVRSNENIKFVLDKRPYPWRLNVECSSSVDFKLSVDVLSNSSFEFEIPFSKFSESKTFTCMGEIFPLDRSEEVSAFWHSRFVVYDQNYQARESIYIEGKTLILGQYAKHSLLNEKTFISNKATTKAAGVEKAYSESQLMRFNYYGY